MTQNSERWYYASSSNEPCGPLSRCDLNSLAQTGEIHGATLVFREGGTEWEPYASLPPADIPAAAQPPIRNVNQKSWMSFGAALGLTLLFCAPVGVIWAVLSKRLTLRQKLLVCAVAILWFAIALVPMTAGFIHGFGSAVQSTSIRAGNPTDSPALAVESRSNTSSAIDRRAELIGKLSDQEAMREVAIYRKRMEDLLLAMRKIPKTLENDPARARSTLIQQTQELRGEAEKLQDEVLKDLQPQLDKVGGDFSSIGGTIGNPLALAAVETKTTATTLAIAVSADGSMNESLFPQFRENFNRAVDALRELRRGINDHR